MGDVFRRRCGCGAILSLRESCVACADRRRAELRAKEHMPYYDMDAVRLAIAESRARQWVFIFTAPARWAAQGVVGRRKAKRTKRAFQVGDRVMWLGKEPGVVVEGRPNLYDFFVQLDVDTEEGPTPAWQSELTIIEPAKPNQRYVLKETSYWCKRTGAHVTEFERVPVNQSPRYVDASGVRVGDRVEIVERAK